MKVVFRWKACDRSKAIEDFITNKVEIFEQFNFLRQNIKFEIIYYAKQDLFKARMNLLAKTSKKVMRAEAAADNIYTAINNVFVKIEDQIRKIKTKIIKKRSSK